jgi:undecaprenyl diphosphate synthase
MMIAKKCSPTEEELLKKIDYNNLPQHVAIIMDGNGRWAQKRFLPRIAGHRVGLKSVHEVVEAASDIGIKVLTLYAFSTENWRRPRKEINALMGLLVKFLRKELNEMHEKNVRFRTIGRVSALPELVCRELEHAIQTTKVNSGIIVNVALNYSGRTEMVDAVRGIIEEIKDGKINPEDIDEQLISQHLYTNQVPDPDLLIRTSGELRISNFLLWQLAYAEIVVTDTFWPDFRRPEFFQAIIDYQKRERRFGAVGKNINE